MRAGAEEVRPPADEAASTERAEAFSGTMDLSVAVLDETACLDGMSSDVTLLSLGRRKVVKRQVVDDRMNETGMKREIDYTFL